MELHEILTKTIDAIVERRGKGAYTRGAVDALEGVMHGLQLRPGASTYIIRDE
jgi:hypothetical protein